MAQYFTPPGAVTRQKGIQGSGEVRRNIARFAREMPKVLAKAAKAEMKIVAQECKAITPVDTGDLRDSITIIEPEIHAGRIYTGIFAGDDIVRRRGPDDLTRGYALKVHEDTEAFHKNGEAKFIEKPWNQAAPHLYRRIGARLDLSGPRAREE